MNREMGEPFTGTGSPPEGYRSGDYVEYEARGEWFGFPHPSWAQKHQYRLEANHPHYLPPVWCLDKAAQLAGRGGWSGGDFGSQRLKNSIIAHARTLQNGCEPMQKPVDPLVAALRELWLSETYSELAQELRARFDIMEKAK